MKKPSIKLLPPNPRVRSNLVWLKRNQERYQGQWIALLNGILLRSADSAAALFLACPAEKGEILFTRV